MDEKRREIRDALLGRISIEKGAFTVVRKGLMQFQFGMQDGFGSVLFFGIQCRMMWYRIPGKRNDAQKRMDAVLNSMGRKLVLQSAPKLSAVYCMSVTGQPVVLTARMGEKDIEVFAYSGKGLIGMLSNRHVIKKFEKGMPDAMNPLTEEKIKAKREAEKERSKSPRQIRKEQKAAEKKAARAEKKEKRRSRSIFATITPLLEKPAPQNKPIPESKPTSETKAVENIKPVEEIKPAEEEPKIIEKTVVAEEPKVTEEPVVAEETKATEEIVVTETPEAAEAPKVPEESEAEKEPEPVKTEKSQPVQNKKNKKKKKRKH